MLSPLKKAAKNDLSTLDIETDKEGGLLELAIYDGESCYHFSRWEYFLDFIQEQNDKKTYRKFVAHNGGRFDWISLVDSLPDEYRQKTEIVLSQSSIVFILMQCFNKQVVFTDSSHVLSGSLDALSKQFDIEHKKQSDIDASHIEWYYENAYNTFRVYLQYDVISLYEIIQEFQKIQGINFFPITAASLALYKFRKEFLDYDLFSQRFETSQYWDAFYDRAYAGGRVECFRPGKHKQVYTYDINSLYPTVMQDAQIPLTPGRKTKSYNKKLTGFYHIKFDQKNINIPPLLWIKGKNGLEFVYQGEGVFYSEEIELAKKYGDLDFKVLEGVVYPKTTRIFENYVDHYYKMRKAAQKDGSLEKCCKLMLNSLYGKFAQKSETESIYIGTYSEVEQMKEQEKINGYKEYNLEKAAWIVNKQRKVPHRLPHISAIITARARCLLNWYIIQYADCVVYCDTDSVHLTRPMDQNYIDQDKLGYMKQEEQGSGIYTGRKQYVIGDKIKWKGYPHKSKLGQDPLTWQDFERIAQGQIIEKTYYTFPALKSVLTDKSKSCKINANRKKLRKQSYTTHFQPEKQEVTV